MRKTIGGKKKVVVFVFVVITVMNHDGGCRDEGGPDEGGCDGGGRDEDGRDNGGLIVWLVVCGMLIMVRF